MPFRLHKIEAPGFLDNRHMKMVRLSALRTDRLYPLLPQYTLGTHFFSRLSEPQSHSAARRINSTTNLVNQKGTETRTFRIVAQCLIQLRHHVSVFLPVLLCNVEVTYPISNFPLLYTAVHN